MHNFRNRQSSLRTAAALAAAGLFGAVLCCAQSQTQAEQQAIRISRAGTQPAQSLPVDHFTGAVRMDSAFQAGAPGRVSGGRVLFEPGARTAWHTHPLGQTLIITAGTGRVQRWGDSVDEMRQGDVVWIPPGQKHWHGAGPNTSMTHIAITEQLDGKTVEWLEKVSDAQYAAPLRGQQPAAATAARPRPSQAAMGDFAPKLAEITDNLLYGDIWERPDLSKRDRSLVTVSALIAMNRPDQLRSHLRIARQNGVTQDELIEAITHLAFYAGWPNAVTAIGVAREVFKEK